MLFTTTVSAMTLNFGYPEYNEIKIDNRREGFHKPLFIVDNSLYVPLRELMDKIDIPIQWNEEEALAEIEPSYKDNYQPVENLYAFTEWKEDGVIPDKETALAVGKLLLEKYMDGTQLEFENESGIYYLDAVYSPADNSWRVYQAKIHKTGGGGGSGIYSPTIILNKFTGEVTLINTSVDNEYYNLPSQ